MTLENCIAKACSVSGSVLVTCCCITNISRVQQLQLVQSSCSVVSNSATPWTAARWASLSIANTWNFLKLLSNKSAMPSNYLIFCRPLLLLPSIFPSISSLEQ